MVTKLRAKGAAATPSGGQSIYCIVAPFQNPYYPPLQNPKNRWSMWIAVYWKYTHLQQIKQPSRRNTMTEQYFLSILRTAIVGTFKGADAGWTVSKKYVERSKPLFWPQMCTITGQCQRLTAKKLKEIFFFCLTKWKTRTRCYSLEIETMRNILVWKLPKVTGVCGCSSVSGGFFWLFLCLKKCCVLRPLLFMYPLRYSHGYHQVLPDIWCLCLTLRVLLVWTL